MGLTAGLEDLEKRKISFASAGIRSLDGPARSLGTIPTALSQLTKPLPLCPIRSPDFSVMRCIMNSTSSRPIQLKSANTESVRNYKILCKNLSL